MKTTMLIITIILAGIILYPFLKETYNEKLKNNKNFKITRIYEPPNRDNTSVFFSITEPFVNEEDDGYSYVWFTDEEDGYWKCFRYHEEYASVIIVSQ